MTSQTDNQISCSDFHLHTFSYFFKMYIFLISYPILLVRFSLVRLISEFSASFEVNYF